MGSYILDGEYVLHPGHLAEHSDWSNQLPL